jgi:ribosomal protein L11 methyltransferase
MTEMKLPAWHEALQFCVDHLRWERLTDPIQLSLDRMRWERLTSPTRIPSWTIRSPWDEAGPDASREVVLNMSFIFGIGTHHGTRAMLANLETLSSGIPRTVPILDFGCGNGILAIACSKLGFTNIEAVDISDAALSAAKGNARLNGAKIRFREAVSPGIKFWLSLANLPTDLHENIAPTLIGSLAANGSLLVTGYDSPSEREQIVSAYLRDESLLLKREEVYEFCSVLQFVRR